MGNQLVGVAPSQIYPVEHYLTHYPNLHLQFDKNLGSTRFFKVAKAVSNEGAIVCKVFVLHDLSLLLPPYQVQIDGIRERLVSAFNCLAFRKAVLENGAAFLMREYVKYNLYDRISTRPFLAPIEKKWIAFQILCALHQCHKNGVCHGDIKMENIMVTSWLWVLLTDFASFKPVYLPDDDPADFSFFFDTSRRRTCYIAPERFAGNHANDNSLPLHDPDNKVELIPSMDIFSAGYKCVLAELFSDGHPPFDLSQLLAYRNSVGNDNYPKCVEELDDPLIKDLIKSMIQLDASKRLSAEVYLDRERGRFFPECFYSFFQSYMLIFSRSPQILSADEKIEKFYNDIEHVTNLLKDSQTKQMVLQCNERTECEELTLITTLVTSCVRGLRQSTSKLRSMEIMYHLCKHTSSETILDRILPYVLFLLHDDCSRVRVSAIHTVNNCLKLIENVPVRDANIFSEYILPDLSQVIHDEAIVVKIALAQCIAEIAETSLKFLEYSQKVTLEKNETPRYSYENELANLHELIQKCVSSLLTDPHNIIKRTLMENGVVKLCIFFGRQKSNDILLSHMVTFLNDNVDKQLRGSFFDHIAGVAGFIGVHCSSVLTLLLQQGFTDSEEFVMKKAINAMSALTELGLLHKSSLYKLLSDTACFLIHPNLWIRQAVVGFLSVLHKSLTTIDIQCKVLPIVHVYLKSPIIQIDKPTIVLNALRAPIPRVIYDTTVKYPELEFFIKTLQERQKSRQCSSSTFINHIPSSELIPATQEQHTSFQNFFRRLESEEMNDTVEDKLLLMADHLRKLHKYFMNIDQKPKMSGKIDVSNLQHKIKYHSMKIEKHEVINEIQSSLMRKRLGPDDNSAHLAGSMNDEWKHMFSYCTTKVQQSGTNLQDSSSGKKTDLFSSVDNSFVDTVQENSYIQYRHPPCRNELMKLIKSKREQFGNAVMAREWAENEAWSPLLSSTGWKFKSILVAHLHEHKSSVNKLVPIPDTGLFASCSNDGFIRLWDCSKMEGRNIANKSKQYFNTKCGALNSMTICRSNQSLAVVSNTGTVMVYDLDSGSGRMKTANKKVLDLQEDGCAIDIAHFDPGCQSVLVYATMYGSIVGWDLRTNKNAWKLENKLKEGVVTAMCMDTFQSCLIVGTGCGYHTCIDLRFRLPISSIIHPYAARVRKIIRHPKESSWIISAVQGNNEISVWDLESGDQRMSFWASDSPPLSKAIDNQHSVCAMYAYSSDKFHHLLSGGTDQRVRRWQLKSYRDDKFDQAVENHKIILPAANDTSLPLKYLYDERLVDGTRVIQEHKLTTSPQEKSSESDRQLSSVSESQLAAGPEQPPAGHRDTITDINLCRTTQSFLVTAAHDGAIKVWK